MMCNFFIPTNFRYPNPMAALPSYVSKNEVIRFLSAKEKEALYSLLTPYPSLHAAARLMIEGGLRRSEALWLPRQALADDLSFMSIINQVDTESDVESTLKTGSRPVTILPPLREFLKSYLPTVTGQWLVPSPTGKQWIGDNFGDAHREVLRPAGLDHRWATQPRMECPSGKLGPPFTRQDRIAKGRMPDFRNRGYRVDLEHVSISQPNERRELSLLEPGRQCRDDEPGGMHDLGESLHPQFIALELVLGAVEIDLEFVKGHVMRAGCFQKGHCLGGDGSCRRIILGKRSRVRGDAQCYDHRLLQGVKL